MLHVDHPSELLQHVGRDLGVSAWRTIDQDAINAFAALNGDTHWLHTDPERAKRDGPFGGTIAHGYMTLALVTAMMNELLDIGGAEHFVNYGLDRLRFTNAVRAGARLRLHPTVSAVTPIDGGVRTTVHCIMEIDGEERPAMVADTVFLAMG